MMLISFSSLVVCLHDEDCALLASDPVFGFISLFTIVHLCDIVIVYIMYDYDSCLFSRRANL